MVCSQIVWGVLTNGVFSKCVGCFNKWYVFKLCGGVFTNSVFLQIVWMSVCVVQIRWVRPTPYWSVRGKNCEQMHLENIQSILPDMSAMWVSQVQSELSEYYPDIRICIHMSRQVLSNLLDKAVCFNCQWKAHLKNDLVLNRPSFGALSQGIFTKSWDTCEVQMDMPDILTIRNSGIWIYTYKSMISTSFHRTQVRSSPCQVTL